MRLVMFSAPWCNACAAVKPQLPNYVEVIDVNDNPEIGDKYTINHLPTFMAIDDCNDEIARVMSNDIKVVIKWYGALNESN